MKTLDEVIKALKHCEDGNITSCLGCPYADEDGDAACFNHDREDALHYLKEYRDAYGNVIASMNHHLRKIHELEQNDPLTWDELRTMEGKPVWIEEYDAVDSTRGWRHCRWMLVEFVNDTYMDARNSDGEQYNFDKGEETWQAYRKERE